MACQLFAVCQESILSEDEAANGRFPDELLSSLLSSTQQLAALLPCDLFRSLLLLELMGSSFQSLGQNFEIEALFSICSSEEM